MTQREACTSPHADRYIEGVSEMRWKENRDHKFRLELYCVACGEWISWRRQSEYNLAIVGPKPSSGSAAPLSPQRIRFDVDITMLMYTPDRPLARHILEGELRRALEQMVRTDDGKRIVKYEVKNGVAELP